MFCSQCGARVEDGTTVCPGCGARVYRVQLPGGRSVFYFRAAGAEASGDAEAREAMVRERETATDRNSKTTREARISSTRRVAPVRERKSATDRNSKEAVAFCEPETEDTFQSADAAQPRNSSTRRVVGRRLSKRAVQVRLHRITALVRKRESATDRAGDAYNIDDVKAFNITATETASQPGDAVTEAASQPGDAVTEATSQSADAPEGRISPASMAAAQPRNSSTSMAGGRRLSKRAVQVRLHRITALVLILTAASGFLPWFRYIWQGASESFTVFSGELFDLNAALGLGKVLMLLQLALLVLWIAMGFPAVRERVRLPFDARRVLPWVYCVTYTAALALVLLGVGQEEFCTPAAGWYISAAACAAGWLCVACPGVMEQIIQLRHQASRAGRGRGRAAQ